MCILWRLWNQIWSSESVEVGFQAAGAGPTNMESSRLAVPAQSAHSLGVRSCCADVCTSGLACRIVADVPPDAPPRKLHGKSSRRPTTHGQDS